MRRDDDLVGGGSSWTSASLAAITGLVSTTKPCAGIAGVAQQRQRLVEPAARRGAARVLVDDVAVARLADRRDHRHVDVLVNRRPLAQSVEQGR